MSYVYLFPIEYGVPGASHPRNFQKLFFPAATGILCIIFSSSCDPQYFREWTVYSPYYFAFRMLSIVSSTVSGNAAAGDFTPLPVPPSEKAASP